MDGDSNDFVSMINNTLCKDGQNVPTANLPMATFIHTGVGNATARTNYAAAGQVQDDTFTWGATSAGTANAQTIGPTPAISAYAAGQRFRFIAGNSNSGATTLAVSGLAAKNIYKLSASGPVALTGNEIIATNIIEVQYDGTQFQLISNIPASGTAASANTGTSGHTVPFLDGANTWSGNQTLSGVSFSLSGNISATAWTTSGIRYKNVAATLTDTSSSGTVSTAYTDVWGGNTIAASSATTFTNYYGTYFVNPIAGTNVTLTNKYALGADSANFTALSIGGNAMTFPGAAASLMSLGGTAQAFSGGVRVTAYSIGTVSSGTTTLDTGNGPLQYLTNGGAFTLAAPSNDGSMVLLTTNNASAGTITFSGFSVGSNTGDTLNTTNTNKFMIQVTRVNGTSTYTIKALQ